MAFSGRRVAAPHEVRPHCRQEARHLRRGQCLYLHGGIQGKMHLPADRPLAVHGGTH